MKNLLPIVAVSLSLLCGCGGGNSNESTASETAKTPPAAAQAASNKGIGPVADFDVASLDPARAPEGAAIFETKCTACHKVEERYIGPALSGVTTRREPEWILNMILNPDVMVKEDETAKALLAEYLAPMTNQNLTEEEAQLILTWFLENDKTAASN